MWDWIIQYWAQALFGIILGAIVAIIKTEWSKSGQSAKAHSHCSGRSLSARVKNILKEAGLKFMPKMLMINAISHIITSGRTAQWTICTRRS